MPTKVALLLLAATAALTGQVLSPAWVEIGESGSIARIIVAGPRDCPRIEIDGRPLQPMLLRQPVPAGLRPACEASVPATARSASVNGQALALPHGAPSRVIVFGDTGCRVKDDEIQACNDPDLWPFAQVSATAAGERPDLVIHVGDYLYRESPCPVASQALCGGTPNGDNWDAWNADFFTPAARLLAAAPWAFSRGNHEDCNRSWRGWFYYLDPRPFTGVCQAFSPPYVVKLGAFELIMLDSASVAANTLKEDQAALYAKQLASLPAHAPGAWLADHHPFWGLRTDGAKGKPAPVSPTLEEAWDRAAPTGISLVLSGHVHLFELLSYDTARPVQLVAGDGGTALATPLANSVKGMAVRGAMVLAGDSQHQFGYTLLTRAGPSWDLTLRNRSREIMLHCVVSSLAQQTKCPTE
jgi:hypothetical protein